MELRSGLVLDGQPFHMNVSGGAMEIGRELPAEPELTIDTDPATLNAIVFAGRELDEAIAAGQLKLTGSREAFQALLGVFALPEPAPPPERSPA